MPDAATLPREKFSDPLVTAKGEERAWVSLTQLKTLWFNTGTLCNLACEHCYIESTPRNDRLVYLTHGEVVQYLDEIERDGLGTEEIGITGGEPFMNPDIMAILETCLTRGYRVLVLTNAMRPMMRHADALKALIDAFPEHLAIRVSVDHYTRDRHQAERGPKSWEPMIKGLTWLSDAGAKLQVAGRTMWDEEDAAMRAGFRALFNELGIALDVDDPHALVLFPEMDGSTEVPEITTACWDILGVDPDAMMCASQRMVVKRKGAEAPAVLACTLLAYDEEFELGHTLAEASRDVRLNHPHCARFCVLGGASCSG